MGIYVVWAGTYCKYDANWFREQVSEYCDEVLITDDHGEIGDAIAKHSVGIARVEPSAIFGIQMERHQFTCRICLLVTNLLWVMKGQIKSPI